MVGIFTGPCESEAVETMSVSRGRWPPSLISWRRPEGEGRARKEKESDRTDNQMLDQNQPENAQLLFYKKPMTKQIVGSRGRWSIAVRGVAVRSQRSFLVGINKEGRGRTALVSRPCVSGASLRALRQRPARERVLNTDGVQWPVDN
ncbi:hypothetical protein EVAR_81628_1 [Eumeta japonica]|uniref:Uncharacterized protein n=1 Tax=Eumeta variegata TaxID=151549 RepID=A0A4C1WCF0_EUMVA|nr:hypothetical protein EVAR_81628_1 [Eumeta japonica]